MAVQVASPAPPHLRVSFRPSITPSATMQSPSAPSPLSPTHTARAVASSISRPLPSLPSPVSSGKRPHSRPASASSTTPYTPRTPAPSASSRRALGRILNTPGVLACLLYQLSWQDFYSLSSTCRQFRNHILQHPECRHVVLSHYVPGYRLALQIGDNRLCHDISVDPHDFTLFVMSQFVPLHKYPMQALSILSALSEATSSSHLYESTSRFVALTQAHSRFVLLLQSMIYSDTSRPLLGELEDALGQPWSQDSRPSGVRELVFPAPLSYFGADDKSEPAPPPPPKGRRIHRRTSSVYSSTRSLSLSPVRASGDFQLLMQGERRKSRLGIPFGAIPKLPPPPPRPELGKYQSASRRKSTMVNPSQLTSISDDEGKQLRQPTRQFSTTNRSSESSLSNPSPPSSSRSNTEHLDSSLSSNSPRDSPVAAAPSIAVPRGTSPHDIYLATSRTRAPILRTFVPCTDLDEAAATACEEQLIAARLWQQLSVGDVVCNLGYVPPSEGGETDLQKWLIFNGDFLVPYIPPSAPPVADVLSLPSPFYYAHIMPPFVNPVYVLAPPALPRVQEPHLQFTLVHLPTRVRSPHSPSGFAVVKKYAWLARVPFVGPGHVTEAGLALGRGWQGEWVLEGEGTREGRQCLLDALTAEPTTPWLSRKGMWEVVREKSGSGRLWIKLLTPGVGAGVVPPNIMDSSELALSPTDS